MQIRIKVVAIVLVASLVLLFGGWFAYQQYEIEKPLKEEISQIDKVSLNDVVFNKDEIDIEVTFTRVDDLESTYRDVYEAANKYNKRDKRINIIINDSRNALLSTTWKEAQFTIQEGVSTHRYSIIPAYFDELASVNGDINHDVAIDEQFVFITLKNGNSELYSVIPRLTTREVNDHE